MSMVAENKPQSESVPQAVLAFFGPHSPDAMILTFFLMNAKIKGLNALTVVLVNSVTLVAFVLFFDGPESWAVLIMIVTRH